MCDHYIRIIKLTKYLLLLNNILSQHASSCIGSYRRRINKKYKTAPGY